MSTENAPGDDRDLEAFLARQSPVSTDYDKLSLVDPSSNLDEKILAVAKDAAKSAAKPAPVPGLPPGVKKPAPAQPAGAAPAGVAGSAVSSSPLERRMRPRPPTPATDDDDDAPPSRRPRWLLPAALAAGVLAAVGLGLNVFMASPSGTSDSPLDVMHFAKRARAPGDETKSVATTPVEQEAEVAVLDSTPLPPPPVFEAEGPQVQDLDAAIALIRKELVLVNQMAATQEEARLESQAISGGTAAARESTGPAGKLADAVAPAVPAAPSVVQPRERRLTKILELYDGGNPDLAGDSLEIFLRDFEDDPISQRILGVKP